MQVATENVGVEATKRSPFVRVRLERLLEEVASAHRVTIKDMRNRFRDQKIFRARAEFCYRAYVVEKISIRFIKEAINRRCHTSIRNAIAMHCVHHKLPFPEEINWRYWLKRRAAQLSGHQHRQRRANAA